MGFCRAVLTIGDEQREFAVSDQSVDQESMWTQSHSLHGEAPAILVVTAEKGNFTQNQFMLLADIAAETWNKASTRWLEINGVPLEFQTEAKESTNEQRQKLRKQYQPTY